MQETFKIINGSPVAFVWFEVGDSGQGNESSTAGDKKRFKVQTIDPPVARGIV